LQFHGIEITGSAFAFIVPYDHHEVKIDRRFGLVPKRHVYACEGQLEGTP